MVDVNSPERAKDPSRDVEQVWDSELDIRERAVDLAEEITTAIRSRPYTTIAVAVGLAFAAGALWKLNNRRPASQWDALASRFPQLANALDSRRSYWR